jgi:hypothetical protein
MSNVMLKRSVVSCVAVMTMVFVDCGSVDKAGEGEGLDNIRKEVTSYNSRPNGTGVHIGSSQPESWFGLADTSLSWFMNGFSQRADGSYWATGWYSADIGLISADARIIGAQIGSLSGQVRSISTSGSQLRIELVDGQGRVTALQNSQLIGLTLTLRVPDVTGLLYQSYQLRFDSAEQIDSQFSDLSGYKISYIRQGLLNLLGSSWKSYCTGSTGESQRAVFYQGSQWNPLNAARQDGSNLITMTCESGSVAKCMSWGYRPWGSAQKQDGTNVSLIDHLQTCIHMKRASYCGDSNTYTVDGTRIFVNDQLSPPINQGSLDRIEALWSPSGATCLSNRRHPELLFLGCANPLPVCPQNPTGNYLLANGLPPAGSLLGLSD